MRPALLATSRLFTQRAAVLARMSNASAAAAAPAASMSTEAKLAELGYKLPAPPKNVANYIMCNRVGNLIYTGA